MIKIVSALLSAVTDAVEGEFTPMMIFMIISVINLIILIVEAILKLVKKGKMLPANYVILAGQLAKLVSAAVLIIMLVCSVSQTVLTALCAILGLCALVCLFSAIMTGIMIFTGKELKASQRVCRIIYTLCCIFVCGFIVYFQLFHFWA